MLCVDVVRVLDHYEPLFLDYHEQILPVQSSSLPKGRHPFSV